MKVVLHELYIYLSQKLYLAVGRVQNASGRVQKLYLPDVLRKKNHNL